MYPITVTFKVRLCRMDCSRQRRAIEEAQTDVAAITQPIAAEALSISKASIVAPEDRT